MPKKILGPNAKKMLGERNKKRNKAVGKILLFACVATGLITVYFAAYPEIAKRTKPLKSLIAINDYRIKGLGILDSAEVTSCINIDENSNFFNVSTDLIAREIEKIQGVERVKVTKKPFSNLLDIKITQRTPSFLVNVDNELHWADKSGILWKSKILEKTDNYCLVVGLGIIKNEIERKIPKSDMELFERTHLRIRGKGAYSNNIKSIAFKENDVIEFAASNVSVPIRLNATLKYGTDDLMKFENILRNNGKPPTQYFDVYENAIFAK